MVIVMKKLLVLIVCSVVLAGCATSRSGEVYSRDQTRREMNVRMGTVESVREIQLEGTRSGVGTVAGGAVGGVAGSSMGKGRGEIIGAVIGAVAGGLAGSAIEQGATRKQGVELTVRLDDGKTIAVVQEDDPALYRIGDRVRVLSDYRETRVAR